MDRTTRAYDHDEYRVWPVVAQESDADGTRDCGTWGATLVDWLVVDHYRLDAVWEERAGSIALNTLVIDDLANRPHACQLLVDQNLSRSPGERYRSLVTDDCRVLLGPEYALLREEFTVAASRLTPRSGCIRRILVFFGGTDPTGETLKSCRAVAAVVPSDVKIDVVVGATNPRHDDVERFCRTDARFRYHCQIANMAEMIRRADLAIGAGGTSTWERTFLGLPTMTVAVAENQIAGSEALAARGAIRYLGTADAVSDDQIATSLHELLRSPQVLIAMGQRCLEIHGANRTPGVERVIHAMKEVGRVSE